MFANYTGMKQLFWSEHDNRDANVWLNHLEHADIRLLNIIITTWWHINKKSDHSPFHNNNSDHF